MRRYKMVLRYLTVTVILLGSFTSASRAQENPCSTRGGVTICTLNPGLVATYPLSRAPNTIAVGLKLMRAFAGLVALVRPIAIRRDDCWGVGREQNS